MKNFNIEYPDICIQNFVEPWWTTCTDEKFKQGRLVWTFIPHINQNPYAIIPTGRQEPTEHKKAEVQIKAIDVKDTINTQKSSLPVASIPLYDKEIPCMYRAKKRPALIISAGGPNMPPQYTKNKPSKQLLPNLLVAPCYTADEGTGKRAGYNKDFIEKVKQCEYPQFMWDILPIAYKNESSLIRLDHIQPVGRTFDYVELTKYCLTSNALKILNDWLYWLIKGTIRQTSEFKKTRDFLMNFEKK